MWLFIWDNEPSKIFVGDTAVSKVFVWDTQVRPNGWRPWANTIAYYPLNSTTTVHDMSGNWYNLTNWNSTPFEIYYWVNCAKFTTSNRNFFECSSLNAVTLWNIFTVSFRYNSNYPSNTSKAETQYKYVNMTKMSNYRWWNFGFRKNGGSTQYSYGLEILNNWSSYFIGRNNTNFPTANIWHNEIGIYNNGTLSFFFDGTLIWTRTWTIQSTTDCILEIGRCVWSSSTIDSYYQWWMSEIIIENKARTAQEIADYYNQTKGNYWIS